MLRQPLLQVNAMEEFSQLCSSLPDGPGLYLVAKKLSRRSSLVLNYPHPPMLPALVLLSPKCCWNYNYAYHHTESSSSAFLAFLCSQAQDIATPFPEFQALFDVC